ncbi:MAG: DNA/RNA non-specific endonuclease [Nocardioidaceae bacterium]|nr:DNA/RNA non-specific endonuclease [Nocardioidaceae bacterium]
MASIFTLRHQVAAAVTTLLLITCLSGCAPVEQVLEEARGETGTSNTVDLTAMEGDYFTVLGPAQRNYETTPGVIEYCPLDHLERAVCAYGELTSSLLEREQAQEREDITIDPAGWPEDNDEVDIPALKNVEGSQPYHGWMMNRSHLIADSLGGAAEVENLVTGTRTQNVGSTQVEGQYAGGMAHTELLARQYLSTQNGDVCPLYYAATPQYSGSELVPRTVIVDILSCDGDIDERVEVFNTAAGWEIDYRDGSYGIARAQDAP